MKHTTRVLSALASDTSATGMARSDIMARTGMDGDTVSFTLNRLKVTGRAFRLGKAAAHVRWFASQERAQACSEAHERDVVRATRTKPAPKKAPPPQVVPAGVQVRLSPRAEWLEAAPVITAETRVTICPSGTDNRYRFDPPPGWRGELGAEWKRLMGKR